MKILLIGAGPLPDEKKGITNAAGLRTQQFLTAITTNFEAELSLLIISEQKSKSQPSGQINYAIYQTAKQNALKEAQKLKKRLENPVIIGVNTYPSYIAAQIADKKTPFWADLNGWAMAEGQAQARIISSNAYLQRFFKLETTILKKADKISTVSNPQKLAVLGELALLGRLGQENFFYKPVTAIFNATEFKPLKKRQNELNSLFRGEIVPKAAFVICQIGGFNAWLDEETLFKGLEKAMAENPDLYFVTTGGKLQGIDEQTYPRFQERVNSSKFKNRFILLGWIDAKEVIKVYEESDALINVDFETIETLTGARNRLTEGLKYNLPLITTKGSEISKQIAEANAGLVVANGNALELASAINKLAGNPELAKRLQQNGAELVKKKFSIEKTCTELIKWLRKPDLAPDQRQLVQLKPSLKGQLIAGWQYLKTRGLKQFIKRILRR
jgi:glycosyltransferase involved in cell wall biosynthesis